MHCFPMQNHKPQAQNQNHQKLKMEDDQKRIFVWPIDPKQKIIVQKQI